MDEPLKNCEYFLVEYAPSPLRETRVAVGLFLFEASGRLAGHGFTRDWRHVRCLDPQADLGLLANLPAHFEAIRAASCAPESGATDAGATVRDRSPHTGENFYNQLLLMREDYSGTLQISSPRGVLTANPDEEFHRLFQEHVERPQPLREKRPAREGSRRWIHARLSEALHRHSLWDKLSRDIPVDEFTAPGDGFRIDFAYRPNGVKKYLHAISLEREWNHAKLLSYTFWRIREKTEARMTAIVSDADPAIAAVESCRQILDGAGIALQPLSLLDPYLEGVSRELRRM